MMSLFTKGFRKKKLRQRVSVFVHQDFLCFCSESGRQDTVWDFNGFSKFLPPDADKKLMGETFLEALNKGRYIVDDQEFEKFISPQETNRQFDQWISSTMHRYGFDHKNEFLSGVKLIDIKVKKDTFVIFTTKINGPGNWNYLGKENWLHHKLDSTAEELGASISKAIEIVDG